jgi:hypothetical protein
MQRIDAFPNRALDVFRAKIDVIGHLTETIQEQCFTKCAQHDEIPLLSLQEGYCFRNCVTKISSFYPSLQNNL